MGKKDRAQNMGQKKRGTREQERKRGGTEAWGRSTGTEYHISIGQMWTKMRETSSGTESEGRPRRPLPGHRTHFSETPPFSSRNTEDAKNRIKIPRDPGGENEDIANGRAPAQRPPSLQKYGNGKDNLHMHQGKRNRSKRTGVVEGCIFTAYVMVVKSGD